MTALFAIHLLTLPLWFVLCYGMDRAHSKALFSPSTCDGLKSTSVLMAMVGAFIGPIGVLIAYLGTNFAEHGFTLE